MESVDQLYFPFAADCYSGEEKDGFELRQYLIRTSLLRKLTPDDAWFNRRLIRDAAAFTYEDKDGLVI